MSQGLKIRDDTNKNLICKLNKSLYGIKHVSRMWFTKLNEALTKLGFNQCKSDYALFTNITRKKTTIIFAYVDDPMIAEN